MATILKKDVTLESIEEQVKDYKVILIAEKKI